MISRKVILTNSNKNVEYNNTSGYIYLSGRTSCVGTNYYDVYYSINGNLIRELTYSQILQLYCTISSAGGPTTYEQNNIPTVGNILYGDPTLCQVLSDGYWLYMKNLQQPNPSFDYSPDDRLLLLATGGTITNLYVLTGCTTTTTTTLPPTTTTTTLSPTTTTTTTIAYNYYNGSYYACPGCSGDPVPVEFYTTQSLTTTKYYTYGSNSIYVDSSGGSGLDGEYTGLVGPYDTCSESCNVSTTTTTLAPTTTTTTTACSAAPVITNITLNSGSIVDISFTGAPANEPPYTTYWEYNSTGSWVAGGSWSYPTSPEQADVGGSPTGQYCYRIRNYCSGTDTYSAWSNEFCYNFGSTTTTTTTAAASCYSYTLYYSNTSGQNACDNNSPSTYYGDTSSYSSSTLLYTNSNCTTAASSGYYSNKTIWKYWSGSSFTSSDLCNQP